MTTEEISHLISQIKNNLKNGKKHEKLRLKTLGFHGVSMEEYKSWDQVFASMREYPKCVKAVEVKCPVCRQRQVRMWYSNSQAAWEDLCGEAGYLRLCPNCGIQIRYNLILMN